MSEEQDYRFLGQLQHREEKEAEDMGEEERIMSELDDLHEDLISKQVRLENAGKELESLRQSLAQEKERADKIEAEFNNTLNSNEWTEIPLLREKVKGLEVELAQLHKNLFEKGADLAGSCAARFDLLKRLELLEGALVKAEDAISETLNWADAAGQSGYWYDHLDESRDKLSSLLNSPGVGKDESKPTKYRLYGCMCWDEKDAGGK